MSELASHLLSVHAALKKSGFDHAFGGAIALAYCTREPRGTRDIDVNVFVGEERAGEVLDSLPEGVLVRPADHVAAARDGHVRVMWNDTPIDLLFDVHEFHSSRIVREVPFESTTIPVLGCESLIIFKAMFNRTRHWADIEDIISAGSAGGPRTLASLRSLLGPSNPATIRFAALLE